MIKINNNPLLSKFETLSLGEDVLAADRSQKSQPAQENPPASLFEHAPPIPPPIKLTLLICFFT